MEYVVCSSASFAVRYHFLLRFTFSLSQLIIKRRLNIAGSAFHLAQFSAFNNKMKAWSLHPPAVALVMSAEMCCPKPVLPIF